MIENAVLNAACRPVAIQLAVCAAAIWALPCAADSKTFNPVADATLIQPDSGGGQWSNGGSYNYYCGRVGTNGAGTLRRGLLRFDLSAIPPGSTVTGVTVKMYMSQTQSATQTCTLHRVTSSWTEGATFNFGGGGGSPEGADVTWSHRSYPAQTWTTPGGDFVATATASKSIGSAGFYTFTSNAGLIADVQAWVNTPSTNFGWLMKGNEATLQTAKRFEARESGDPARWPLLTVTYTPPATPGDLNGDHRVDGTDLGLLLAAWGGTGAADLNQDGQVDGSDLGLLLSYWTP